MQHDIRTATTPPPTSQPADRPCANCDGPHRAPLCDSLTFSTCQATFPTAALRQSHYTAVHQPRNYDSTLTAPPKTTRDPGHRQPEDTYHLAPPACTKPRKATNPPMTAETTPPTPPLPDQEICPPTPGRTLMTKRSNLSQTSAQLGRPPQTNHPSLQPPRTTQPTQKPRNLDPPSSTTKATRPTTTATAMDHHPLSRTATTAMDNYPLSRTATTATAPSPTTETTTADPASSGTPATTQSIATSKLSHTTKPDMVSNNGRKPTHPSVDKVPTNTTRPPPRPPRR